jgi:phytoene dehydrogenase-like protein
VVVGGGWGGFGAALALANAGAKVTLLDASENPGGLSSAFVTPGERFVVCVTYTDAVCGLMGCVARCS